MTYPTPPDRNDDDEIPVVRLALWAFFAIVLAGGIYLYFHFAGEMAPLLG